MAQLTGHARVEARSLAMHRAIADKLRARPELLAIAHDNLRRWMAQPGHSQPYFEEWLRILARPLEEILAAIWEDSEHMTALRQSTPFAGVLSPRNGGISMTRLQREHVIRAAANDCDIVTCGTVAH